MAWRCWQDWSQGEHAEATVVGKEATVGLVLQVASGSQTGLVCTAETSTEHLKAVEIGSAVEVVLPASKPGECVLAATLANSVNLLWLTGSLLAVLVLMLVLGGLLFQRSQAPPTHLSTRLDVDPKDMACPQCGESMIEGYLPLLSGIHWRELQEPTGIPNALSGLPGTVGWRGRPRLHAYRCADCQVVTFRYGR